MHISSEKAQDSDEMWKFESRESNPGQGLSSSVRVLGFTFTSFALLFCEGKYVKEKKQLVIQYHRVYCFCVRWRGGWAKISVLDFGRCNTTNCDFWKKLRPEVHNYLCVPFTHIVTWSQHHRPLTAWTSLASYPETRMPTAPRRCTLNKNSTWAQHGTQAASSRMQDAACGDNTVTTFNNSMARNTVIVFQSIPVTFIDGIVSFKKEGALLHVEHVLITPCAFWSRKGNVKGPFMSRQEMKDWCVEVHRAYDHWPYTFFGRLLFFSFLFFFFSFFGQTPHLII